MLNSNGNGRVQTTEIVAFLKMILIVRADIDCTAPQSLKMRIREPEDVFEIAMADEYKYCFHEYLDHDGATKDEYPSERNYFDRSSAFLGGTMIKRVPLDKIIAVSDRA